MSKQIALFFDGTWNEPGDTAEECSKQTNVWRFYQSVVSADKKKQLAHYISGIGTGGSKINSFVGGLTGAGINANILDAYLWLSEIYNEGDLLFLFGFSRGAYTARSFSGVLRKCGIIKPEFRAFADRARELYQLRDKSADSDEAIAFRNSYSVEVNNIEFIGVWDTVGALGIPWDIPFLKEGRVDILDFHDTRLSSRVKNAYHALAIDEFRSDFKPTLWNMEGEFPIDHFEQRWFVGSHSDIGGGYPEHSLSNISLKWMQEKAISAGLAISPDYIVGSIKDDIMAQPHDSRTGVYLGREKFVRPLLSLNGANEMLDESVKEKMEFDRDYKPQNVLALKQKKSK